MEFLIIFLIFAVLNNIFRRSILRYLLDYRNSEEYEKYHNSLLYKLEMIIDVIVLFIYLISPNIIIQPITLIVFFIIEVIVNVYNYIISNGKFKKIFLILSIINIIGLISLEVCYFIKFIY